MTWNLKEGLEFVRKLEAALDGCRYHVGLTGSVLNSGSSEKDLDVIVYPHNTSESDPSSMYDALLTFGLKFVRLGNGAEYEDDKNVSVYDYNGKRVDIFSLE